MKLPWNCEYCGASHYHYGGCNCTQGQINTIDSHIRHYQAKIDKLKEQREALTAAKGETDAIRR